MQYAKLRTYCVLPIISSERTDRNAGSVEHCSLRVIADTIADSNRIWNLRAFDYNDLPVLAYTGLCRIKDLILSGKFKT